MKLFYNQALASALHQNRYPLTPKLFNNQALACALNPKLLPFDPLNSSMIKLSFVRCIKLNTIRPQTLSNNQALASALYQNRYPLTP